MERIVIVKKVRILLNDYSAKNRLLGNNVEFSDEEINDSIDLALSEINTSGVVYFSFTENDCPEYLLLLGTAKYLLSSAISLKSRNTVVVNEAGGGSVNREGNLSLYMQLYQDIRSQFDHDLSILKARANLEGAFSC